MTDVPIDRLRAIYGRTQELSEMLIALHLLAEQHCDSSSREDRAIYGLAEQADHLAERIADELDEVIPTIKAPQEEEQPT